MPTSRQNLGLRSVGARLQSPLTSRPATPRGASGRRSCNGCPCRGERPRDAASLAKGDTMPHPETTDLDALLRTAAPVQREPAEQERVLSDVWSRVQAAIAGGEGISDDGV